MLGNAEMNISRRHLEEVIRSVDEPLVLLGGWAVNFLVNDRMMKTSGRGYLGSRDIDLGFRLEGPLEETLFARVYEKLTREMGFRPLSFRLFKEIDIDTGELLDAEKARTMPSYQIFQMYVDLIVEKIPKGFRKRFGFVPVDEPLLGRVFDDRANRFETEAFGRKLWMPSPSMLVAMKVRSFPNRDKEHKRIKDLADIAALVMFSPAETIKNVAGSISEGDKRLFETALNRDDIQKVSELSGMNPDVIDEVISKILR